MKSAEEIAVIRSTVKFDEMLDELLASGPDARKTVAELLSLVTPSPYKEVAVIAECGEAGVVEAIPQIKASFSITGKGRRDHRSAAVQALADLLHEPYTSPTACAS